jgi:ATP-dependent protease ClpP protease subunit
MSKWYEIMNKSAAEAEVMIYDAIGRRTDGTGISAKEFISDLNRLTASKITLSINSPGGNVFDGNAIYNALRSHKAQIHARIDGIAASIASVIAMAGDTVTMPENAMMMIHRPWSVAIGTSDDMRSQAEALDKIQIGIVSSYRSKTKLDDQRIKEMMAAETWMTAAEAVELGFADKMTDAVEMQASFDVLRQYRNVPGCLFENSHRGQNMSENTDLLQRIKMEWNAMTPAARAEYADDFQVFSAYKRDVPGVEVRTLGGTCLSEKIGMGGM